MLENRDIIDLASKFKFFSHNRPDDFADELSFKYSSFILVVSSMIIIYKQFFALPISCYMATSINNKGMIRYMEHYCWLEGTYPISFNSRFPTNEEELEKLRDTKILYYQWVPFILVIQALLCYLPQLIWRIFYRSSSHIDLNHLITKASQASNLDNGARLKAIEQLTKNLETLLFQPREYHNGEISMFEKVCQRLRSLLTSCQRSGIHLMSFYLFVKVLYLINAVSQIYMMKMYLNLNYTLFGIHLLSDIASGRDWKNTLAFPRKAYCFAKIHQLGTVNVAVAQCVLPVNMLNERLYIFFWFWMSMVTVTTIVSIIAWIFRLVIKNFQTSFVKKYLILNNDYYPGDKFNKRITKFEDHFLRGNGLFILQMLSSNSGEIITAEVVSNLWKTYKMKYEKVSVVNDDENVPVFGDGENLELKESSEKEI